MGLRSTPRTKIRALFCPLSLTWESSILSPLPDLGEGEGEGKWDARKIISAAAPPGRREIGGCNSLQELPFMKINIDLKAGFLQSLKREVLATLTPEERAIIEVSTGEMGNKPDAVKLGWLKMRTGEIWTKQRYTRALKKTMDKLKEAVARESGGNE